MKYIKRTGKYPHRMLLRLENYWMAPAPYSHPKSYDKIEKWLMDNITDKNQWKIGVRQEGATEIYEVCFFNETDALQFKLVWG